MMNADIDLYDLLVNSYTSKRLFKGINSHMIAYKKIIRRTKCKVFWLLMKIDDEKCR